MSGEPYPRKEDWFIEGEELDGSWIPLSSVRGNERYARNRFQVRTTNHPERRHRIIKATTIFTVEQTSGHEGEA